MSSIDRDYVGKHLSDVEEAISVILEDCSVWSETHYISEENSGEEVKAVTLDELLDLAERDLSQDGHRGG